MIPQYLRDAVRERGRDATLATLRANRAEETSRLSDPMLRRPGGSDWYARQIQGRIAQIDSYITALER